MSFDDDIYGKAWKNSNEPKAGSFLAKVTHSRSSGKVLAESFACPRDEWGMRTAAGRNKQAYYWGDDLNPTR